MRWTVCWLVLGMVLAGCPDDSDCDEGRQVQCACIGGGDGVQVCSGGEFGNCHCPTAAGRDASAVDATPTDAGFVDAQSSDADGAAPDVFDADLIDGDLLDSELFDTGLHDSGGADAGTSLSPPQLAIACHVGAGQCGNFASPPGECPSLVFGAVSAPNSCELLVELSNLPSGAATANLDVSALDVLAHDIQDPNRTLVDGTTVGFSILDATGQALTVDAGNPLVIPAGDTVQVRVRFDGTAAGIWRGEGAMGSGFIVRSNDLARPAAAISLSAIGTAAQIAVLPQSLAFGPTAQGGSRSSTVAVQNVGSADLTVTSLATTGDPAFSWTTSSGAPPFSIPSSGTEYVYVHYAPTSAGAHAGGLVIESNDGTRSPLIVPLSGGATPRLELDPPNTLTINAQMGATSGTITARNVGFGDLVITELDIVGPGGSRNHPSVDDFQISGCAAYPCAVAIRLCAASAPGCSTSSETIIVDFMNNDLSTSDLAELRIRSNDPGNPTAIVVLSAISNPCQFPTPLITVETATPSVGRTITVNALASLPGGGTLSGAQWSWLFTPGPAPALSAPTATRTSFVPTTQGTHVIGLHVSNSCGATSPAPASEAILVAP